MVKQRTIFDFRKNTLKREEKRKEKIVYVQEASYIIIINSIESLCSPLLGP